MRRVLRLLFLGLWLLAEAILGAQQRPTFRSSTRLIVHAVTVTDGQGRPIDGLGANDFEVTENGRSQQVAFAEYQRLETVGDTARLPNSVRPAIADDMASTRAEITIPAAGDGRYRSRRLIVLYFDLSTMGRTDLSRAFAGAIRFVDREMGGPDAVAIMTFDGGVVRVREDFSDDRERLSSRLKTLESGDADGDGIVDDEPSAGTAFGENGAEFNLFSTDRQLAALQAAIRQLRPISEQKSLIYFGSGLRLNGVDNQAQLRATVNAAVSANVTINPVDARGLVAAPPLGNATTVAAGGASLFSGAAAQGLTSRLARSQDTLHALAHDTGGAFFSDHNDLSIGVARAIEAMTSYYLVGYYSTDVADDGRFRKVRVSLRGRPGGRLAYRDGYVADKAFATFTSADKERQLEEALHLDNPITDVPLAVEVNAFRLNRNEYYVPVSVRIPGRELSLARHRGASRTLVDVIGEVKDPQGVTHRNMRDRLDIRLDQATAAELAARPLQYETGFTLLPGAYVLKMLVRDATTGRMGTYEMPFSVRNVERGTGDVPMSSIVLASQRVPATSALHTVSQKIATDHVNPLIVDGMQFMPSVTRVFTSDRDLHVFFHAYQTDDVTPTPLVAYITLYRDDQPVLQTDPIVLTTGVDRRTRAVPASLTAPLISVEPGTYECQVTVLSPTTGLASFWRTPIAIVRP